MADRVFLVAGLVPPIPLIAAVFMCFATGEPAVMLVFPVEQPGETEWQRARRHRANQDWAERCKKMTL